MSSTNTTAPDAPSAADALPAAATGSVPTPTGEAFISPRVVAAVWFVAMLGATAVNPATTETIQPTLLLTIIGNLASIGWLATMIVGGIGLRRTAAIATTTGALALAGHFICGLDGHLPMTGGVWLTQLMLVAGATAVSGLALLTRR